MLTIVCAAGWHLGMLSILIQAGIVSYLYPRVRGNGSPLAEGVWYGLLMGLYMGSYGVLAEAGTFDVGPLGTWLA